MSGNDWKMSRLPSMSAIQNFPNFAILLIVSDKYIDLSRNFTNSGQETIFDNTLDWVCHIQYGKIHEEHSEKRTADTCIWLENNRIFQEWVHCRSSSAVLWLRGAGMICPHAIPSCLKIKLIHPPAGTGKTILA